MVVKVNQQQWNELSPAQQQQISDIISQNFKGETVIAAEDGESVVVSKNACTVACDVAEAAAIAACSLLPFGQPICVAVAQQAGNLCRSKC